MVDRDVGCSRLSGQTNRIVAICAVYGIAAVAQVVLRAKLEDILDVPSRRLVVIVLPTSSLRTIRSIVGATTFCRNYPGGCYLGRYKNLKLLRWSACGD